MRVLHRLSMLTLLGALCAVGACILGPKQDDPAGGSDSTGAGPPGDLGADAAPARDSSGGGGADTGSAASDTATASDAPPRPDTGLVDGGADMGAPGVDAAGDTDATDAADAADASDGGDDGDASPIEDGG